MENKFLTIMLIGLDKHSAKHYQIPAKLVTNFKKYALTLSVFCAVFFAILIIFISGYASSRNENSQLLSQIDDLQKKTDIIQENKVHEKFTSIDENLSRISAYLNERGVRMENGNNYFISNDNVSMINYYQSYTSDVYNTLRKVPLGSPYDGEMSSGYGYRTNPFGGARGEFHPGIDFKGTVGDEIRASADGYVCRADWYGGYGNAVMLEHIDGITSLYGHMSRLAVTPGQFVRAGDLIGYLGSTGRSTGPHVHYEIRRNGEDINPIDFLTIK